MNTDQQMTIKIGNFGTLQIGHLSKMGNKHRERKGLNSLSFDTLFKRQDFWEFVVSRNAQMLSKINSADSADLKSEPIQSDYSMILCLTSPP
ncbi:hypothetical protein ThvES_00001220 [Thiovulum sp. ES]|nr:hypothetical protein ThvES_00001220 [Thiovulum sp. ES]